MGGRLDIAGKRDRHFNATTSTTRTTPNCQPARKMRVVRSALLSLSFAFGVAGQSSISTTSFLEQKAAAQQAARQNLRKRQNHAPSDAADSLVDASGDSECAYPPPFSPNNMYDGLARDSCFSGPELDMLNIEAAAFR